MGLLDMLFGQPGKKPKPQKTTTKNQALARKEMERLAKLQALEIEYPNRRRIFDESQEIILNTNNPDVLFSRYKEMCDFVSWSNAQKRAGMPLRIEEDENQMKAKLRSFFNFHCVRIAKYISGHSPKSKRQSELVRLKDALLDANNKLDSMKEIYRLIEEVPAEQKTVRVGMDFFVEAAGWEKSKYYVDKHLDLVLSGLEEDYLDIPESDYEDAQKFLKEKKEKDRILQETARLNNLGIEHEKSGQVDEAISVYEEV